MGRHTHNIIKCIKIMQEFLKCDSYFRVTQKGNEELLLLEGRVDKKSWYT